MRLSLLGLGSACSPPKRTRNGAAVSLDEQLEAKLATISPEERLRRLAIAPQRPDDAAIRASVLRAAQERRRCLIRYLKSGATEPEIRHIEPYVVAAASGWRYVLARCCRIDSVEAFRIDRFLAISLEEVTFEIPADFDPRNHFAEGRVFRAAEEVTVSIRYFPRIARWIVERGPVVSQGDGSVVVYHRVADPRGVVRHVLQYGVDAEILAPPEFRELVRQALERMRRQMSAMHSS
jgi:predicted DNA-binding transcriptional regulator YafY